MAEIKDILMDGVTDLATRYFDYLNWIQRSVTPASRILAEAVKIHPATFLNLLDLAKSELKHPPYLSTQPKDAFYRLLSAMSKEDPYLVSRVLYAMGEEHLATSKSRTKRADIFERPFRELPEESDISQAFHSVLSQFVEQITQYWTNQLNRLVSDVEQIGNVLDRAVAQGILTERDLFGIYNQAISGRTRIPMGSITEMTQALARHLFKIVPQTGSEYYLPEVIERVNHFKSLLPPV